MLTKFKIVQTPCPVFNLSFEKKESKLREYILFIVFLFLTPKLIFTDPGYLNRDVGLQEKSFASSSLLLIVWELIESITVKEKSLLQTRIQSPE